MEILYMFFFFVKNASFPRVCKVFVETQILKEVRPVSIKAYLTLRNCGHRRGEVSSPHMRQFKDFHLLCEGFSTPILCAFPLKSGLKTPHTRDRRAM